MSNFEFLKRSVSELYEDAYRAEAYLGNDSPTACFYARRAIETLVHYIYRVRNLPMPYQATLAAMVAADGFSLLLDQDKRLKFKTIRLLGNDAAHKVRTINERDARRSVEDLYHLMVWAVYNHSRHSQEAPLRQPFDLALTPKARQAALSQERMAQMEAERQSELDALAQDYQQQLAEKDAKILELLRALEESQAAKTLPDTHDYNEAATRDHFIDLLLQEAGWPLESTADREFEVTGMPTPSGRGFVDYVLWGPDGTPLGLVEAKRSRESADIGRDQAKLYADALQARFGQRPVIFYTNGYQHYIWDDAAGYPPREIRGFLTADELQLMIARRRDRQQLAGQQVDTGIAGRPYQLRAIAHVAEAFDAKQRKALLVMATGSGKTRTTIAMVDMFSRAGWVKRVLFLADRTALVNQAVNAFKKHLPQLATVNLVTEKDATGRVYASTYPTMLNIINRTVDDSGLTLREFGPGYFDLIVVDEAHRSVYAKYKEIFEYFDALLLGLTATPKDEVDFNTYSLFDLEAGVPTDAYTLEEAVADKYLVPARGVSVGTQFMREGIRYDQLTAEQQQEWDAADWGDETPDEVTAEALNRFLFNADTVDKVLTTLMQHGYRVDDGERLGKTIIFAKNQAHADFIYARFNVLFPGYGGTYATVITNKTYDAQGAIDQFSEPASPLRIAISVDMLDTGVDVPEVLNLVFFKLVRSKTKFWQMLGRGTRLCPDVFGPGDDKKDFLVFDFCQNLEYFSQNLPGAEGQISKPLTQRIFEARAAVAGALVSAPGGPQAFGDYAADLTGQLSNFVRSMNLDNVLVRPHRAAVEKFNQPSAWQQLSPGELDEALSLGAVASTVKVEGQLQAKQFDLLMLSAQLAVLQADTAGLAKARNVAQRLAENLLTKTTVPAVRDQAALLEQLTSDDWWEGVTPALLEFARKQLRGIAHLLDKAQRKVVYTNFQDTVIEHREVDVINTQVGMDSKRFEQKMQDYLRQHLDSMAMQKVFRNKQLTRADFAALEQLIESSGIGTRVNVDAASSKYGGMGVFVRSLVGLERAAVQEEFAVFLDESRFSAQQIRFVQRIIEELSVNGMVDPGRLYEDPYTSLGDPFDMFGDDGAENLVSILVGFRARAQVA